MRLMPIIHYQGTLCVCGGGGGGGGGTLPPLVRWGGYISVRLYCRNDFIFNAL